MKFARKIFAWFALGAAASTLFATPPRVVSVMPADGTKDVEPGIFELRVVFDQAMQAGFTVDTFKTYKVPQPLAMGSWLDTRTFVLSMKSEPGQTYGFSLNTARRQNFRSASGEPLAVHTFTFQTKPAPGQTVQGPPTAGDVREANREAVVRLKQAIEREYSHRDLRGVDWKKQFAKYTSIMESARSAQIFAAFAAELVEPAQDVHLKLEVEGKEVSRFRRSVFRNIDFPLLRRLVPEWKQHNASVCTGRFPDGIGYLYIGDLVHVSPADFDPAFRAIEAAAREERGLILDLRGNKGGSDLAAEQIAGCFVEQPVVFGKYSLRRGEEFTESKERLLAPNPKTKFRAPVVVLIGRGAISSAESFALMMKAVPGSVLMGDPTAGCSGNPQPVDLGNGVTAFVPRWRNLRPDGSCIEGEGVLPDIALKTKKWDFRDKDPVLEAALAHLRKPPTSSPEP